MCDLLVNMVLPKVQGICGSLSPRLAGAFSRTFTRRNPANLLGCCVSSLYQGRGKQNVDVGGWLGHGRGWGGREAVHVGTADTWECKGLLHLYTPPRNFCLASIHGLNNFEILTSHARMNGSQKVDLGNQLRPFSPVSPSSTSRSISSSLLQPSNVSLLRSSMFVVLFVLSTFDSCNLQMRVLVRKRQQQQMPFASALRTADRDRSCCYKP